MATRGVRQPRNAGLGGGKQGSGAPLQSILRNTKEDPISGHQIDQDLFNCLMMDNRKTIEKEQENMRPLARRDAGTLKSKPGSGDRTKYLEDELYAERNKSSILQNEIEILEEKLESNKEEYKRNLEIFSSQIKSYKSLQTELLRTKEKEENSLLELEAIKKEADLFRTCTKGTLEFVIKAFEIVALLPEQIEVESGSNDIVDFSFEEKRTSLLPKNVFLEDKIVKFLEANERLLKKLQLEDLLLKIIEEYENKKNANGHYTSPKIRRSSSKKGRSKDQKTSPKSRSPKLRKLVESFSGADHSSFERSGEQPLEKNNFSSNSKSLQNSSGGKNNNYSININLVVNDNSDSMISDNNQSTQVGNQPEFQKFIKFFEKELGCEKDRSDSSIIMSDSLMYSPSDRSSKVNEGASRVVEKTRPAVNGEKMEIVVAQFRFEKVQEGDIELTAGDKIKVISKDRSGWWIGHNLATSLIGYFPSNFVRSL